MVSNVALEYYCSLIHTSIATWSSMLGFELSCSTVSNNSVSSLAGKGLLNG